MGGHLHGELDAFGLVEMVVFAVAVFVSFVYLIANGALDWGPVKRLRSLPDRCSRTRTTGATRSAGRPRGAASGPASSCLMGRRDVPE